MLKLQSSLKAACMALAALAVSGCSQDELVNQPAQKGNTTIVASFEGAGAGTRTSVKQEGDAFNVVWNKDDAFGLFYTSESQTTPKAAEFSCPDADGTKTSATFTGVLDNDITTSYAVYPYDKEKADGGIGLNGTTVTMTLPATLNYGEADKQMASNGPMYALASDISQSLKFNHLAGLLKLTVSSNIKTDAKKFVITADQNIAGTCTADLNETNPVLVVSSEGGSSTITVKLSFENETSAPTTFYIPIPVGEYATLSAQLQDNDGKSLTAAKEWTNVKVTRAGMLTASFGFITIGAEITTNDAIQEAMSNAIKESATEITTPVKIEADIDATKSDNITQIPIPVYEKSNVNLAFAKAPVTSEDAMLKLYDTNNETTPAPAESSKNTVTLVIPKAENEGKDPALEIVLPNSTVVLDAPSTSTTEGATYKKIIATTAKNTLVVGKNVTVNNLVVKGGNVRVAGTVTAISKDGSLTDTPYLIKEKGATLPASTEGFVVVDAITYDLMMAVEKGGTCTLSSDIALTEPIVVTKTTTLDLNGYSITSKDNGSLKKVLNTSDALILVRRGASLTIDDNSTGKTGSIDGSSVASIYAAVKLTDKEDGGTGADATLIVNGGTLKGYYYGISGNGTRHGTSITINGGTIGAVNDTHGTGIYHPQEGTLTVKSGTITGYNTGIEMRSGTLTVDGDCTIKSTATEFKKEPNNSGTTIIGAAVAVSQHTTNKNPFQTFIKNGTLQGVYALYEEDVQDENVDGISMEVTGGNLYGQVFSENCKDFISGGTFNDFSVMNYLADNKDVTVTLDSDVSIIGKSVLVPAGKKATLDLNGHTVTADNSSNRSGGITVKGNFTLKDGSQQGSGKITADKDADKTCDGGIILVSGDNAHMTMAGGNIYAVRNDATNKGQYGIVLGDGGDFTMTGGKIEAGWYAISGNGLNTGESTINISAGELISAADYAVYLPHKGTTTISGGKINGGAGGVAIQRGTLSISGTAEILSTDEGNTGNWTDGTGNLGNAALVVAAKYDDCTVNITGGTFSSLKNAALIDASTVTTHAKVINVSGGTFSDTGVLDYLTDNANVKVLLNADKSVKGFKTKDGQTVEIDLNNYTLTLADPTVGSTGTETNSCQLLKGSKVTFKNGKVQSNNENIMIQNYCDLLLQDVTVEATSADYVVSNNNGSCTINNSTITAGNGKCAFDVYSFSTSTYTYPGVTVTVNGSSTINGNVEFGGNSGKQNGKLIISGGTFKGNLKVQDGYYNASEPNIVITGGDFGSYTGWDTYRQQQQ